MGSILGSTACPNRSAGARPSTAPWRRRQLTAPLRTNRPPDSGPVGPVQAHGSTTRLGRAFGEGQGLQGAAASLRLREAPEAFLATIQIAITLAGTLAGAVGGVTSVEVLTPWLVHLGAGEWAAPLALAIVILVITYLALVLGELTPKAIALRDPERLACRIAPSIEWLSRATGVIVWFLTASTNAMLAAIGQHGRVSSPSVSKEEIRYLVREGVAKGLVDQVEEDLVHRALAFADTTVPEVMTPRMAVRGVDIAVPAERLLAEIAAIGYTRVPVFRGSLDHIVGVIALKKVVRAVAAGGPLTSPALMSPPMFVTETARLSTLLGQFQHARQPFALVVDEHGELKGLVTIDDVLGQIVGDLREGPGPNDRW